MVSNVLDIESFGMSAAIIGKKAGILFLGFAAAFPSLSREYIHMALTRAGVPAYVCNAIKT
eukprot:4392140-Alexandrium_andersonii.AAC.1